MRPTSSAAADAAVYLDHAAATPVADSVSDAMREATGAFANPSSPHAAGRAAKRMLEDARERILALLGGRTAGPTRDRLVFTSGATEANRLAVLGLAGAAAGPGPPPTGWIGGSARDHASIRLAARELAHRGWHFCDVPLEPTGGLARESLAAAVAEAADGGRRGILTVTTICGQTGIREDVAGLAAIVSGADGFLVHADATQAAGWEPTDFAAGPWGTLALAPHKFGGPRGIGAVVVRAGVPLEPIVPGPQELGLRGGTEAVPLAAGFVRAMELAVAEQAAEAERVKTLRDRLEAGLIAAAAAAGLEALVVGGRSPRAPHVVLFAVADVDRQAVAMAADLAGVCLATGTACASGASEPPAVLAALQVPVRFRGGGLRLSLGRTTTAADVDLAVARLTGVFDRFGR